MHLSCLPLALHDLFYHPNNTQRRVQITKLRFKKCSLVSCYSMSRWSSYSSQHLQCIYLCLLERLSAKCEVGDAEGSPLPQLLSATRGGTCTRVNIGIVLSSILISFPEPIRVYFVSANSHCALMMSVWGINNSVIALAFALMDVRDGRVWIEYVELGLWILR
jgi:hypothetical protein